MNLRNEAINKIRDIDFAVINDDLEYTLTDIITKLCDEVENRLDVALTEIEDISCIGDARDTIKALKEDVY